MKTGPHVKLNKKPPETLLTRKIRCKHGCKNIFFTTVYWRDQHDRRFHYKHEDDRSAQHA